VGCAAQKAVALAQQEKSTWTRADVIKYLGRVLPRTGMDPAAAAALLEDLADRAMRSEFEPVTCLEAPEPADVPRGLLRADGRSIYQRHGGTRYATRAQLVIEERMLAQARASGAPRLTRAQAARVLGADLAQLDAALAGRADATRDTRTRTGLRADQAAAAAGPSHAAWPRPWPAVLRCWLTAGPRRPGRSATCSSRWARPGRGRSRRRAARGAASRCGPSGVAARTGTAHPAGSAPNRAPGAGRPARSPPGTGPGSHDASGARTPTAAIRSP
jgi:hypothetical protein